MSLLKLPLTRRHFAKGVGAAGMAGFLLSPLNKWHQPLTENKAVDVKHAPSSLSMVLVSNSEEQTAFLRGAQSTQPSQPVRAVQTQFAHNYLSDLDALLSTKQPTRIIGLTDDASATLVMAMARRHGAKVMWLGQHRSTQGHSEHHIISATTTKECAVAWGQHIDACGVNFQLTGNSTHSRLASFALSNKTQPSTPSDDWATSLGYLLAALDKKTVLPATPLVPSSAALQGQFVSFVIQA